MLQDIINGYPSIIFVKDVEGRFLTINNKLEELLEIKNEELKGKTDYDIFSKEEAEYYREHDRKVLEEGKALPIEEEADLVDGHHVFIANKFPLYDINGEPYGEGSISTDITERKKLEEELKRSNAELHSLLMYPVTTYKNHYELLQVLHNSWKGVIKANWIVMLMSSWSIL